MKYILFSSLLVFLSACEAKQESQQQARQSESGAAQRVERLDPYSAPLHRAQNEALATDFEVTLLSGEPFRLSDQKGKVVVMNIWATWCPPCRDETPDLVDLHNSYNEEGLVILGVSIDEQGESVVRPFMEEFNVTYPMYIDTDETVMSKYGPTLGIPTTYIIGREGHMRYFAIGALTKKELEPRITELLAEEN